MRSFLIGVAQFACLFVPAVACFFVGYRSIVKLAERPTRGGHVMIVLISKLVVVGSAVIFFLIVVFKIFTVFR